MNTKRKVTVALVSGIAIGALGIESLRAQSKPAGFLVAEFEVTDPVGWESYQDGSRAMPANDGVFLVRATKAGEQPKMITIVQFPTVQDAIAFDSSPAYTAQKPLRDKSSNWRFVSRRGSAEIAAVSSPAVGRNLANSVLEAPT